MLEIVAKYSWAWMLPIALLALVTSLWFYYYKSSFDKFPRVVLALLRFFGLFLIGLFLLEIFVKSVSERTEKPLLLWLEDHSTSVIAHPDSQSVKQLYGEDLITLRQNLKERYRIRAWSFAERLDSLEPQSYEGMSTNIAQALEAADIQYQNLNIGAMVLVSDGIYNLGYNPQYRAANFKYPIFTLGVGSAEVRRDAALASVTVNELTYLDNEFPLEISVVASKLSGEELNVKVRNAAGEVVFQETGEVTDEDTFMKFSTRILAQKVGLQRYTVHLEKVNGEVNTDNNYQNFVIDVLDNRKEIHLISNGLHPDMAAIKQALMKNKNYLVRSFLVQNYRPENNSQADLVVVHSPQEKVLKMLAENNTPYFMIAGMQTDKNSAAQFLGIKWYTGSANYEEVRPLVNTGFTVFNISSIELQYFNRQPPVQSAFGKVKLPGTQQVLLHKKVGSVDTEFPLLSMGTDMQNRKMALFNGEGLWRWRIYNFKNEGQFENFNNSMLNLAQYLLAGSQRRRFAVKTAANYQEGRDVTLQATLYNASFKPTVQGEVDLQLQNEAGQSFSYSFRKNENSYQLNLGTLEPGIYRYRASAVLGNENFKREGDFVVRANDVERRNLMANHGLLQKVAQATKGQFFTASEVDSLSGALMENPEAQSQVKSNVRASNILDWKWLWALIILLFTAEWALRKYWGY